MATSRESFIQEVKNSSPGFFDSWNDWEVYEYGKRAQIGSYSGVDAWDDASARYDESLYDPSSLHDPPDDLNFIQEMFDYGVDENSYQWMQASYVNSLTGKAQELMEGKPRYDLSGYNPTILEDIGSMFMSLWYPLDVLALFGPGSIAKAWAVKPALTRMGLASSKYLGPAVGKSIESGITLASYEGAMGGVTAAINGEDVAKGVATGVLHGGIMGGVIGFTGGGMGARHSNILRLSEKYNKSIRDLGKYKALEYAATGTVPQIATEAIIFTGPQVYDMFSHGIVDTDPSSETYGKMRDANKWDLLRALGTNVGFVSALKAQGWVLDKFMGDREKGRLGTEETDKQKMSKDTWDKTNESIEDNVDINKREKDIYNKANKDLPDNWESHNQTVNEVADAINLTKKRMEKGGGIEKGDADIFISFRNVLNGIKKVYSDILKREPGNKNAKKMVDIIEQYAKESNEMAKDILYKLQDKKRQGTQHKTQSDVDKYKNITPLGDTGDLSVLFNRFKKLGTGKNTVEKIYNDTINELKEFGLSEADAEFKARQKLTYQLEGMESQSSGGKNKPISTSHNEGQMPESRTPEQLRNQQNNKGEVDVGLDIEGVDKRISNKYIDKKTGKEKESGIIPEYEKVYNDTGNFKNVDQASAWEVSKKYILDEIVNMISHRPLTGKRKGKFVELSTIKEKIKTLKKLASFLAKKKKSFETMEAKDVKEFVIQQGQTIDSASIVQLVKKVRNITLDKGIDAELRLISDKTISDWASIGETGREAKKRDFGELSEVETRIDLESDTGGYKREKILRPGDTDYSWSGKVIVGLKNLKDKIVDLSKKSWYEASQGTTLTPFRKVVKTLKGIFVEPFTNIDSNKIITHFIGRKKVGGQWQSTRRFRESMLGWASDKYGVGSKEHLAVQYNMAGQKGELSKVQSAYANVSDLRKAAETVRDLFVKEIIGHVTGKKVLKKKINKDSFSTYEIAEGIKKLLTEVNEAKKNKKTTIKIKGQEYDIDVLETFVNYMIENPHRNIEVVFSKASAPGRQLINKNITEITTKQLEGKAKQKKIRVTKEKKEEVKEEVKLELSEEGKKLVKEIKDLEVERDKLVKQAKEEAGVDVEKIDTQVEVLERKIFEKEQALDTEKIKSFATEGLGEKQILTKEEAKAAKEEGFGDTKEFDTLVKFAEEKHNLPVKIEESGNLNKKQSEIVAGTLIDGVIKIARKIARPDTIPHEIAHNVINVLKAIGSPQMKKLIKDGIRDFGSEENLVKKLGQYAGQRIKGADKVKLSSWVRRFWSRLKTFFNIHNENDVIRILGTEVLTGKKTVSRSINIIAAHNTIKRKAEVNMEEASQNIETKEGNKIFKSLNGVDKKNATDAELARYLDYLRSDSSKGKVPQRKKTALFNLESEILERNIPSGHLEKLYSIFKVKDIRRTDFLTIDLITSYVKEMYTDSLVNAKQQILVALEKRNQSRWAWLGKYTKPLAEWVRDTVPGKVGIDLSQRFFNFDVVKDTIYRGSSNTYIKSMRKNLGKFRDSLKWLVDSEATLDARDLGLLTKRDIDAIGLRNSGLEKLGLKNFRELSRILDNSGERFYSDFKLFELKNKGKITAEEYKILSSLGDYSQMVDFYWVSLKNEILNHAPWIKQVEVEKVLSKQFVEEYFFRKVTSEGLEYIKSQGWGGDLITKIVDDNISGYINKQARKQNLKTETQLKALLKEKKIGEKRYAKELDKFRAFERNIQNNKATMDILKQEVFDMLTYGRTKVTNKLQLPRGPKLKETYEVLEGGKYKTIRMYHHEFDKIIPGYVETMSTYLATLRFFPEVTGVSKEFKFRGKGYVPELMDILKADKEAGTFIKAGIEALIGIESESTKTNREITHGLSQITNWNVAAGLSSPTSGIKNLMIAIPQMIGQFGLKPTLYGLKTLFSASEREIALEQGTRQFATKGLGLGEREFAGLSKLPYVGKYANMETLFKINLMEFTEAWSRQASMFAGRTFFASAMPVLRGEVKSSFAGRLTKGNVDRMMRDVWKLSPEEINFMKNHDPSKLSEGDRRMLDFINDKIDHYSHVTTQGGTSAAMLPLWMSGPTAKALTTFQRIAASVTWNTYQNYIKPIKTHKNLTPIISVTVAQGITGKALYELYNTLFGVEMPVADGDPFRKGFYYLWKGEALGVFSDAMNPYGVGGGLNVPIMEPVIFRNFRISKENMDAWLGGSKTFSQALKDWAGQAHVLTNQIMRARKTQMSELYELHKRTGALTKDYLKQKGKSVPLGPTLSTRRPYYVDFKNAFFFGKPDEIARSYWSAYNMLFTELNRDPDGITNIRALDKKVKQTLNQVIEQLKPVNLSDDPMYRRQSSYRAFLRTLEPEKARMVKKAMSQYEYRRRIIERIINDHNNWQKYAVTSGRIY